MSISDWVDGSEGVNRIGEVEGSAEKDIDGCDEDCFQWAQTGATNVNGGQQSGVWLDVRDANGWFVEIE